LPSEEESKYRIEAMQNIPDSLKGFQPDMNPDLREVLEALGDDAPQYTTVEYSDNEDPEAIFAELVKGGAIEEEEYEDDDDGYVTDDTVKAADRDIMGSEYLAEMAQYKAPTQHQVDMDSVADGIETESAFSRTSTANTHRTSKQRRKRRQKLGGAYSEVGTDYSMTSSINYRNEGLTMLDAQFDKVSILLRVSDFRFWRRIIQEAKRNRLQPLNLKDSKELKVTSMV
jgi:protein LTV1